MYQRILVPVDDSATSALALQEATKIAAESKGVVRLVHVLDLAQFGWGGGEFLDTADFQESARDNGQKILGKLAAELSAQGVRSETVLLESFGDTISELLVNEAQTWGADLIAMGTHGWGEIMQLLLGSVAEGVLRQTRLPVLLVRAEDEDEDI